jgi:formimidoylglutamate deiminase
MAVLCDAITTASNVTAIHCTHTTATDLARYVDAGGRICCCPLTEGNLGDGIPELRAVPAAWSRLCLGSDSNLRISPIEDMRWLEYGQRLRGELRGALPDTDGAVVPVLLAAATEGGAAALGLEAGRIAPGAWADLVAVDLSSPTLVDLPPERILDAVVFGGGNEAIAGTWVGGRWRPTGAAAGEPGRPALS